jgi:hypothetical protein
LNGTEGVEQGVIFSLLCLYISNFRHSDWPRTQNVNKHADWLTLFALVVDDKINWEKSEESPEQELKAMEYIYLGIMERVRNYT